MVEVKFCGLTREADAAFAASLGAKYVGVIFAGGPREVAPDRAAIVYTAASAAVQRVGAEGVPNLTEVKKTPFGRLFEAQDPDGYPINVYELS